MKDYLHISIIKYLFILVFTGVYMANHCDAQDIKQSVTGKIKVEKKLPAKSTVIISTNEACILKINKKDYGRLNAGETKNITLPNGYYKLTATNAIYDEYQAELNVKGKTSTVHIDLTSFAVKRKRKLDSLTNAGKIAGKTVSGKEAGSLSNGQPNDVTLNDKLKTSAKSTVNELMSNLVSIPAGSFTMGNDLGDNDEGPEHTVTIRQFEFSKYEVTQQQWENIMGANPSVNQGCKDCPVENISFNEIDSFLIKINQIGSKTFRLPTEAEWEYIARKGAGGKDLKENAWYNANSGKKTHAVGSKLPNALGIFDMSGNVAEWCSDWYELNYYKNKNTDNPVGPGSGKDKVVRGGSYDDSKSTLRLSRRAKQSSDASKGTVGLRLVSEAK